MRPRIRSGVRVCDIVVRQTALTLSAAPAQAKRKAAIQIESTRPARAMKAPQIATAPKTMRPSQRAWSSAGGQCGDGRAGGDRGVEQAGAAGAGVVDGQREDWEEGA